MSFSLFFKDRLPAAFICLIGWVIMLCFFGGYHSSFEQAAIISVLYWGTLFFVLIYDYIRKAGFYKRAKESAEGLDRKFLLPEMLDEPSFYEGQLFKELLNDCCKSMTENVSAHRRQAEEFREFIELWVHEVKLPVASLQLMSHNDGEAGAKYASQLTRIDGLIENVLYYSRSENAEKDYIIKESTLSRIFKEAALKNRDSLQQKNVTVTTHGLDAKVMTDSKWLEYIFTQLISNSLKYLSDDREGEITVFAQESEDEVVLHFKDNGIGIPETDLPYIFEKTFTGENGRRQAKSTGMGLYIIKSLCKKLGHRVEARSVKNEWTDIYITFGKNDIYKPI